ncbi:MAG: peptide deformylase [Maricaulis sp.]|jgi:peptide deformylase|uniref:peptide deformylase n=1 Tax=Maricaulis sp. TaxID=1486257 RepID=UPI001B12EAA9|nr:peptide deformylase [Maricaulis sp.]MBO6730005.1 peptide deformylase [Maricaulis sp.]MBO6848807.1 peptide deformylase [Maricaulis sp.]MBO6878853.1 peptide deformylase [Maricaulis sp.]MDM7985657.1 peptide deformylase [Maricaulis sp.]
MAIREILTVPNPVLKEISQPVEQVDDALRALMDDMLETMYEADGIGLAAIQVGVPKRVIVMDLSGPEEKAEPKFFVNPVLSDPSEDKRPYDEGCLSVPGYYETIERPEKIKLTYLDYDGNEVEEIAEGMFATCIQHEMDHLEGVLFIDYLSRLKRQRAVQKVKKFEKEKGRDAA